MAHELGRDDVGGDVHPAAGAAAHLEHPGVDEHLHRLAQRRPADLHLRGERALAWQPVARSQLAGADLLRDLVRGLLERAARLDGGEHGHPRSLGPAVAALGAVVLALG